jgi:hypothetical protein
VARRPAFRRFVLLFEDLPCLNFFALRCPALCIFVLRSPAFLAKNMFQRAFFQNFTHKGNGLNFTNNFGMRPLLIDWPYKKWNSAMFQVLNVGVACPELEKWPKSSIFK